MPDKFPYLYPYSRFEAQRRGETRMHMDSFYENVKCARAIEKAIREHFDETSEALTDGCARSVLEAYGFKRVWFVLSNSLREMGRPRLISDDIRQWGQRPYVPPDGKFNRYFAADTAAGLLESFIRQARDAYQALGMFGPEHCVSGDDLDYDGKVLVLSPDTLKESHWTPRDQLWLGEGGFGTSPHARGQAVYATCLGDGEQTRWNRSDFTGVLEERYLPDWAAEKLAELRNPQQKQPEAPSGGMEMT